MPGGKVRRDTIHYEPKDMASLSKLIIRAYSKSSLIDKESQIKA